MVTNQPQAGRTRETHRLDFFRPDQIAFLVTHNAVTDERLPDQQLEEWTKALGDQLNTRQWKLTDSPSRSYSFPAVGNDLSEDVPAEYQKEQFEGAFSIVVCNVENDRDQRRRLLDLISTLDKERELLTSAGLTVEGVFPNWVASSSSSDSGGTGGPGSEPLPFNGDPGSAPYYFKDLISQLDGKNLYGNGKDVDIAILDTAPCPHDLVLAYKELWLLPEEPEKHRLIEHLLGPDGRLKLYPATYEELLRMGNTSLNQHGYKMVDHGLFIAGIIHSIVPEATIHLIEVLNQFGVGDLETIARGLAKAYAISRQKKQPLVVNCSLVLDLPHQQKKYVYHPSDEESIPPSEKELEELLRSKVEREMQQLKMGGAKRVEDELRWVFALRVICERLGKVGRQVIAAAGNEGKGAGMSRDAPDARYPAAFSKVVGVGALPINAERHDGSGKYNASNYSNLGDKPAQTGVMALGGEPGENNGVLGLYIGEFPPHETSNGVRNESGWDKSGPRSENGWAWWAGTSFATPVLAGAIAAVLSGPTIPSTTQRAVQMLYTQRMIEEAKTDAQEDVMPSTLIQSNPPG